MADSTPSYTNFIKNDALINVTIGVGFYQRMLAVSAFIVHDKTPEDLARCKQQIETGTITEPWIEAFKTMWTLNAVVEEQASLQGFMGQRLDGVSKPEEPIDAPPVPIA